MAESERSIFAETEWWLTQWAAWVVIGSGRRQSVLASLMQMPGDSVRRINCVINDDQAVVVDESIAQLKKRCRSTGKALIYYFLSRGNVSEVARKLEINRKKADVLIRSGIAWIDGNMHVPDPEKTVRLFVN